MSDMSENPTSCFIASAADSLSVSCAISAAAAADSSRRAAFSTASAFAAASAARCNLNTSAALRLGEGGSSTWPNMSLRWLWPNRSGPDNRSGASGAEDRRTGAVQLVWAAARPPLQTSCTSTSQVTQPLQCESSALQSSHCSQNSPGVSENAYWVMNAGSWQTADGRDPRRGQHVHESTHTSVGDFRVRFAVEPELILQPCASRDGRQHGEQDQGARARPALGACATRPGHAVNMLTEERLKSASDTLVQHSCSSPRQCAPHCQSLRSQILRAACAQPAAQSLGDARTCVSSYMGRAGKFVEKKEGLSTIASFITRLSLERAACIIS
eukprot:scaffold18606_cov60-Phaeocystis_antarctica.AAC.5